MLTLITYPAGLGMPSLSPYCVKAMGLLNLSGLDWAPEWRDMPKGTKYGKLPEMRLPGGEVIADSSAIQDWLEGRADLHPGLSEAQKAQSHALVRMVEGSLGAGMGHDRWVRDDCWPACREAIFATVPGPIRGIVGGMVRRKARRGFIAQGIGSFTEQDRLARLGRDLDAITVTLGAGPFLFGDAPTAADAAVAPVLAMIDALPADTGLRRLVRGNAALMEYIPRARAALYPDAG